MSKVTTLQERIEIMELAQAGMSDKSIAKQIAWSESTVRKWRRRVQQEGRSGLGTKMGRPVQGALSTYPSQLREQLRQWRIKHPGWGAKTLAAELRAHAAWQGEKIPSQASIARFLKQEGLSRAYERHSDLPQKAVSKLAEAHERWEMDAKGYQKVDELGYISLINLNDRYSHARLISYPCLVGEQRWQRHPNSEDYQCVLRLSFSKWGLPKAIQVDHGSVFIDNKSKSPFPTRLHLWLLALGVDLQFGRVAQPRDQGITERSHQLWDAQCLQGQSYQDWQHLYQALQKRRDFLNYQLPCSSLDDLAPLQAHPEALHSGRAYRPEWERDLLDLQSVWNYLQEACWYRRVAQGGTITLSQQVYYIGHAWARQDVEIHFDAQTQKLIIYDAKGQFIRACPIQGLSKTSLMGQLAQRFNLPIFQLALPFKEQGTDVIRLFETIQA